MDLALLKAELTTDPLALGYAAGNTRPENEADANILNSLATGRTRERVLVPTWELLAAATRADLVALTAADRALFQMLISTGEVNIQNDRIRASLLGMFGLGTDTRANMAALQTETISRAQELFGEPVGYWDVANARELP